MSNRDWSTCAILISYVTQIYHFDVQLGTLVNNLDASETIKWTSSKSQRASCRLNFRLFRMVRIIFRLRKIWCNFRRKFLITWMLWFFLKKKLIKICSKAQQGRNNLLHSVCSLNERYNFIFLVSICVYVFNFIFREKK